MDFHIVSVDSSGTVLLNKTIVQDYTNERLYYMIETSHNTLVYLRK